MNCLLLAVAAAVVCSCSKATPPKPLLQKPAAFSKLPVEMTVAQRSTTTIPGSKLRLTIDDITRGQVMVSIAYNHGPTVLAATSIKEGESAAFTLNDHEYQLTLHRLENELVGDDSARFVVSAGSAAISEAPGDAVSSPPLSTPNRPIGNERPKNSTISEQDRIERLLAAIENDEGATFIRHDDEHSPREAAKHLRTKWAAAGDEIETAEDFVDKLASKSSLTGEPYRIRRADGNVVMASDYLREKLGAIQEERPASE